MSSLAPVATAEDVVARIAAGDAERARRVVLELARHTPILSSRSLSDRCGASILLKAENLQRTGSFKLRGATNKLAHLEHATGVVAGSAGNHGQSLAYAARARGIPCEVFMPTEAPVAKVAAVEAFGGTVTLGGTSVDDCVAAARTRAAETGAVFVHPFDDPDVILGQATLGLELLEDAPDLGTVVVPIGGGGLISGVAGVIKRARPEVRVVGLQVEACSPFPESLRAACAADLRRAADDRRRDRGQAARRPHPRARAAVGRRAVVVGEDDIAEAMVWLLERSKLVVEGAGAVGVAALLAGRLSASKTGSTVVLLSGGNVDAGLLATIAWRHETMAGRRVRIFTRIPDRPGGLAGLLALIAQDGGNVVHVDHVREGVPLHVRETGVEITLETRGTEHSAAIISRLVAAGYAVRRMDDFGG